MNSPVSYELKDGVAFLNMDDGKVNAMSIEMLGAIADGLDQAEKDNAMVVLKGRDGVFSAGFDLKQIMSNAETSHKQIKMGAELCLKILSFPKPVITICTGHAYPMGAFLMMSADYRFGVRGDFNIGMNEVMIKMTIPQFALELASSRLLPPYYARTTLTGEMFNPDEAATAGFIDQAVDKSELDQMVEAKLEIFKKMDFGAHHRTKLKVRKYVIAAMEKAIAEEQTLEKSQEAFRLRVT